MKVQDKEFEIFISRDNIAKRIKELGAAISEDYKELNPLFIVVLNGGFMFASDLLKEVDVPCRLTFIKVSSYQGIASTGIVKKIFGLEEDVKGQHVIVVDDIIDTGLTMKEVLEELNQKEPASINLASFILKPDSLCHPLEMKYIGYTIPNHFILGYGLDYEGFGRNFKDIYRLKG
ncbi:MAG: hypoxanthine phosphoribosyltransferase [Cytophagaceae bacterium]